MKIISNLIFIAIYAVAFSCSQQHKESVPCLDVSVNYPGKEINLTDIAKVRYLYLNSDNEKFLYRGYIQAMSTNKVVVTDSRSGDIFIFSKDGAPVSRLNRRGRGPGEYNNAHRVFYDEEVDELFVIEPFPKNMIHVYSINGEHKRDINLPKETMLANDIVSLDNQSFLFIDYSPEYKALIPDEKGVGPSIRVPVKEYVVPLYRISKADGAVLNSAELSVSPLFLGIIENGIRIPGRKNRLIKNKAGAFICYPEIDTVFMYGNETGLTPVIYKTPPVSSGNPLIYLNNCVDVGKYQFLQTYTARREEGAYPFPSQYYLRNKETGEIVKQKLFLPDYQGKKFFIGPTEGKINGLENGVLLELELTELKEANAKNKLSGKLKELVDTLADDDNNIFVIVEF